MAPVFAERHLDLRMALNDFGVDAAARLIALRRYRVHVERKGNDPLGEVLYVACPPDPDGGWVRWADLRALIAALRDEEQP